MKTKFFILIAFTVFACSKTKNIVLKTENADGISNETKFKVNGLEVGKIEAIKLSEKGQVLLYGSLNTDVNLPSDSKFEIENEGILGDKVIEITIGKNKDYIAEATILDLKTKNTTINFDSINKVIKKSINNIYSDKTNDSILIELKRLNENLEKIMH